MPLTVTDKPGDGGTVAGHRVDIGRLDAGLLAGLLSTTELPGAAPAAGSLRIAWSDEYAQTVIVATPRSGGSATVTYALDGTELSRS